MIEPCIPNISVITHALSALEDYDYRFYDLQLDSHQWGQLESVAIEKRRDFVHATGTEHLESELTSFLLYLSDSNVSIASSVAQIINDQVERIIASTCFVSALVVIKAEPSRTNPPLPGWHIDKTMAEYIGIEGEQASQLTFLLNLKGCKTLYHTATLELHQRFMDAASSPFLSYGCDKNSDCEIPKLLDPELVETAPFGYGSVHFSGKMTGTIHANCPAYEERLVAIVIPQDPYIIDSYMQTLYQSI